MLNKAHTHHTTLSLVVEDPKSYYLDYLHHRNVGNKLYCTVLLQGLNYVKMNFVRTMKTVLVGLTKGRARTFMWGGGGEPKDYVCTFNGVPTVCP